MEDNQEYKDPFETLGIPKRKDRDNLGIIVRLFDEIVLGYPQLTVKQHMDSIFRSKGEPDRNPKDKECKPLKPEFWSNEKTIGRMEKHLEELKECPPDVWGDDEMDKFDYKAKYNSWGNE